MLLDEHDGPSATSAALHALATERGTAASTMSDDELVARHPVLLSLLPPRIATDLKLPPAPASSPARPPAGDEASVREAVREALRMRIRWVQEATARAARAALALGQHLVDSGTLGSPDCVANLRVDELVALVESGATLTGLVAETGNVLSHLAILAREYGVPTVVGVADATTRFADGTWVLVDGSTGEVSTVDHSEWGAA